MALAFTILAVLVGVVSAGMTRSLPGDPLYGVKRSIEDVGLALARSPESKAAYNARRIDEIAMVVADRRIAEVDFWGEVSYTRPNGWQVGPIYVYGDENTRLLGDPAIGDTVSVRAVTRADGTLLASEISVVSSQ
jgi:hypothetical protein